MTRVTPQLLLRAYAAGLFPMAESADSPELHWFDPPRRGILPLDGVHVPRRLARTVKAGRFRVTADHAFAAVIAGCAAPAPARSNTWINDEIVALYTALHRAGFAHSVECWDGDMLAGGLYGVALGGAFFGESMFSRATDASKVALIHLVARLRAAGFVLLDTQFVTDHLARFGTIEIERADYRRRLEEALLLQPDWTGADPEPELDRLLHQRRGET
ncbi:leucyl/phenylalanyl-tRNA--protein transferase [Inquilinus limosus]|uniref:leucyl/phenylalanyl-tRNA--protein transferase n=1 Tax=Inquilinus limosus TaxID=171674 RepID=UPI0003FF39B2|nr:leucyl/phenylalanyl-tRNA--protein transferase [Inquilinus limosus]